MSTKPRLFTFHFLAKEKSFLCCFYLKCMCDGLTLTSFLSNLFIVKVNTLFIITCSVKDCHQPVIKQTVQSLTQNIDSTDFCV